MRQNMDFFDFFVSLFIYRQIFVDTSTSFCRYCRCCRKKYPFSAKPNAIKPQESS